MLTIPAMYLSSPTKSHVLTVSAYPLDVRPIIHIDRQDSLPVPEARRVSLQNATAGTRWIRKVLPLWTMALLA